MSDGCRKGLLIAAAAIVGLPCAVAIATAAAPYVLAVCVCLLPFLMFVRKPRHRTRRRR